VTLPIVVHPLAERDLIDAWQWYEQQLTGLGDRFVAAVGLAIERAARWPDAGNPALVDDDQNVTERRIAPDGFPYAVRYRILDKQLVVMAIYHQRRRPNFGTSRTL
jgi:plasmid stabilization system protein ParE